MFSRTPEAGILISSLVTHSAEWLTQHGSFPSLVRHARGIKDAAIYTRTREALLAQVLWQVFLLIWKRWVQNESFTVPLQIQYGSESSSTPGIWSRLMSRTVKGTLTRPFVKLLLCKKMEWSLHMHKNISLFSSARGFALGGSVSRGTIPYAASKLSAKMALKRVWNKEKRSLHVQFKDPPKGRLCSLIILNHL